jgi:hypothetical protein
LKDLLGTIFEMVRPSMGSWRRQILRRHAHIGSSLSVARVALDASRLMAHAVPPDARDLETAQQVASHYDNVRRLLDQVDSELDAVHELSRSDASPAQGEPAADVGADRPVRPSPDRRDEAGFACPVSLHHPQTP